MRKAMYDLIELNTGVTKWRLNHYKERVVRGSMIPFEYVLEYEKDIDIPFATHWRDKVRALADAVLMEKRYQNA